MRINKEKEGLTKKFTVRIGIEEYKWIKEKMERSRGIGYRSMNNIINEMIHKEMMK